MAYKAKLAFFDFKKGNGEDLLVPNDVYRQYYQLSTNAGASISSNSWGSPDGAYSSYCVDTDQFVWDHPDFLPIFAAGNYGEENGILFFSNIPLLSSLHCNGIYVLVCIGDRLLFIINARSIQECADSGRL
jgi:hypothetical protein